MTMTPERVKELIDAAKIKSAMLRMGERIAFGSDADMIDDLAAAHLTSEAARLAAEAKVGKLRGALRFGCSAAINSLHDESGNAPEWAKDSGIDVMLSALGCHGEYRLNEKVRAAIRETKP